uniref:CCHC-type domain-containing protein n=1 Tax=Populus alba TaxID=43335 RepID=A0A4U5QIS6_POPAL|nr:hypothetical protein D5086_0000097240 [Populus alba]
MDSSTSSVLPMSSAPEFSLAKTHLPDISIKLASNNYLLCKAQVIPILRGHALLGYVTNDISCPDSTIVGADGTLQLNPAATLLQTLYESHTRDRKQQKKGELQTLSKGSYSLEDYLHRVKSLALSLRGVGKPMLQNAKTTSSNVAFYTNKNRSHTKPHGNFNMCDRPGRSFGCERGGITCFRCGGPNHKIDGCFASDDEAAQYKAFAAIQVRDNTEDSWYPDTGANKHMTSNPSEVQGMDSYSSTDTVMFGNGNGLAIVANHKGYCCLEPHYSRLFINRHVKFNELHFPFKTTTISKSSNPRLFQLQTLPKSLENHALPRPPISLPTNGVSATELVTYQSSEFQPEVPIPLQSVLPSSPTESSSFILPLCIHPMVTRAQTGNLKPKSFFTTRHPIPVCFIVDLTA